MKNSRRAHSKTHVSNGKCMGIFLFVFGFLLGGGEISNLTSGILKSDDDHIIYIPIDKLEICCNQLKKRRIKQLKNGI